MNGAKCSATVYSVIETAKENGLNLMNYLTYLFGKMPNMDLKNTPDALENLLPWGQLPDNCYIKEID